MLANARAGGTGRGSEVAWEGGCLAGQVREADAVGVDVGDGLDGQMGRIVGVGPQADRPAVQLVRLGNVARVRRVPRGGRAEAGGEVSRLNGKK